VGDFTPDQRRAILAEGNVLVVAGAGTGKTRTLVERCAARALAADQPVSLDDILMVTFTEAAAAEMKRRLRERLAAEMERQPDRPEIAEQLALVDTARIATLHSICLQLVREHFHELALDPQIAVLEDSRATVLAAECLDTVLQRHYAGRETDDEAVRQLILDYDGGRDEPIRHLVRRLHDYARTLPDPDGWFDAHEHALAAAQPADWEAGLLAAFEELRAEWLPVLREQPNDTLRGCAAVLEQAGSPLTRVAVATACAAIAALNTDDHWPSGTKGKFRDPHADFFADVEFLRSLAGIAAGNADPLVEDWNWVRPHLRTLLALTREFAAGFARAKRDLGAVDFHDLEQFALQLLWDRRGDQPTALAETWRRRLRLVFVDEYQDINAAQDRIIRALSRDGAEANRFLVGDVKQSIYRFRLADPRIFQHCADAWKQPSPAGQVIPLRDNFRSHAGILRFVNAFFSGVMRREVGGVDYDADARLGFGAAAQRPHFATSATAGFATAPVELHLRLTRKAEPTGEPDEETDVSRGGWEDLTTAEKEAALVAQRLRDLKAQPFRVWDGAANALRPVAWRDMVILLRSPRGKAEAFAKVFARQGIPLVAARGGLYATTEVSDLLNLLLLLDNPLQDLPLLAVLRSPLAGFTLDELAAVRLAARRGPLWTALQRISNFKFQISNRAAGEPTAPSANTPAAAPEPVAAAIESAARKAAEFLTHYTRWRWLARRGALSACLETVLDATHYEDWLLARDRGDARRANVRRFLALTRQFDQLQHHGLFRFLRFVQAQQEAEFDPEPAAADTADAVRLMSIHQSKGLEFPVVVVADLGKPFNFDDLKSAIILDEELGLCPLVKPAAGGGMYPSLPHWRAARRQKRETLGEELRLLYVAATRASDKLLLVGTASRKRAAGHWGAAGMTQLTSREILQARHALDWLGPLLPALAGTPGWLDQTSGHGGLLAWWIYENDEALPAAAATPAASATANNLVVPAGLPARLGWTYPHLAATREPAKTSVSALRRRVTEESDDEARPWFPPVAAPRREAGKLAAAERGTAHHRFLQAVALDRVGSVADLAAEADRLRQLGQLSEAEAAALDLDALAAFWRSETGLSVREHAAWVRRELAFTARLSPTELAGLGLPVAAGLGEDEFVVVQGVADLVVLRPDEIWLLDFKTDAVTPATRDAKVAAYRPQLALYALALARIYRRPVTRARLHFLASRETLEVALPMRELVVAGPR
jgi:ATP-dependent helicase/nuclease subunit A